MSALIDLKDLYLMALAATAEADKLDTVLQQTADGEGRLWLMRNGSTIPEACICFKFGLDDVALSVQGKNEMSIEERVHYAEGIDHFLPKLQKALQAGRLAAPKKK